MSRNFGIRSTHKKKIQGSMIGDRSFVFRFIQHFGRPEIDGVVLEPIGVQPEAAR